MRKHVLLLFALTIAVASLGLAACGDDDDETTAAADTTAADTTAADTGGDAGATISISADPDGELAYSETELTTTAGPNTIEFDNPASIPHDVVVEDDGGSELGRTDTISNDSASAAVDLESGTYTFYCSVPGHREAGMEGTITAE